MRSLSSYSHRSRSLFGCFLLCALLAALLTTACHQSSVVSEKTPAASANLPAKPAPSVANNQPPVAPTVAPTAQHQDSSNPAQPAQNNAPKRFAMSNVLTESTDSAKAMQMPKPTPTPKPRATPPVVMKDGKIVQPWQAPAEAANLVNPFKGDAGAVKAGRELYMQRCEACHGKEGKGNGYMAAGILKPPTNLASTVVQANTDGELFWKITNGRPPMPANRIRFTDEERWQIVNFLRTLK